MSSNWPCVKLGEVIRQERDQVGSFDGDGLPVLGVTNVDGVTRTGVEASEDRSKYLRVRPGRFVYNPYRINVGSIGLATEAQDGICSPAYVVFAPLELLDASFLRFFLKSARGNQLINFYGNRGTVRSTLRFVDLCQIELPLPPLSDQRLAVERIERIAGPIYEAAELRRQAMEESGALVGAEHGIVFAQLARQFPVCTLEEVTTRIVDGPHQTPNYLPAGMPGVPFVTVKNMVKGTLTLDDLNYVSEEDHELFSKRCRAERGDVLYSKDGATRGRPCLVDTDERFSYFVSVALIKPKRDQLDGQYLVHLLNSNLIRDRMAAKSRGDMIPHIVLKEIRAFPVPLLPLSGQRRIVEELDVLRSEVDALKRLQKETGNEFDALLPAVLDRAFRGEL